METNVNNDKVLEYIRSLRDDDLYKLEKIARSFEVPIIKEEVSELLKVLIKMKNPKNILEIGTAIGYSSILMAKYSNANITTIEIDESIAYLANKFIKEYGYEDRINIIVGDAGQIIKKLDDKYDFIFMDGPKAQYIKYFEYIYPMLENKGILVTDNVLYRGKVADIDNTLRRNKTIVLRLREYLYKLTHMETLQTSILPIDDGLSISIKEE